jgi:DNA end-binding protein Ku
MVDEVRGRVVDKENKSRGYEIKGKYIEIEPEEIKAIQVEVPTVVCLGA